MMHLLSRIHAEEAGEAAISIAAIVAMTQLGDTLPHLFNMVGRELIDGLTRAGLL